jgi:GrpE
MTHEPQANFDQPATIPAASPEFGAVDIVAAFTALRHDLKLQIRGNADFVTALDRRFDRLESVLLNNTRTAPTSEGSSRSFAEALAEIENALQRTAHGLSLKNHAFFQQDATPTEIVRKQWLAAGWLTQRFSAKFYEQITAELGTIETRSRELDRNRVVAVMQSIELLQSRVHRLMSQRGIQRRDAIGLPFDSEWMNAIEAIDNPTVPPGHVARQHKPAYFWDNKLLTFAEVDVVRTNVS